ncbi:DUF1553 domain-containing protein [bacterium]|nr:DUF1553 domain-containing protein [bacterium]
MIFVASAQAADPGEISFSRDVLPILSDRCFACHGPDKANRKADLRLDDQKAAFVSGVIEPGKPGESELIARIESPEHDEVMPPPKFGKPLTSRQIDTLKAWVAGGAKWGRHWAWDVPIRPNVPTAAGAKVRNPIDAFVVARLKAEGLTPRPEATKAELIRRVSLDLTGLPPDAAEVRRFLSDDAPEAYERLVDRLLASPRYGERMAWDWLDAARYADTNGYQGDGERTMWPWRDWVVGAFNEDMPFDRFTVNQIAGDLMPEASRERILATAFNRNHMINGEGGRIAEENRVEYVFDQTETVGTMWLGLTLTCARCHDHKYDPVSRRDYYRLFAFFDTTPVNGAGGSGQTAPVLDMATPAEVEKQKKTAAAFETLLKVVVAKEAKLREAGMVVKDGKYDTKLPVIIESILRKGPNDRAAQNYEELKKYYGSAEPEYLNQLDELRKLKSARDEAASKITRVMVMGEAPQPRETFMLTRGAYDKREDKVSAGLPASFVPGKSESTDAGRRMSRRDLAEWLVSPENPLTARVTVNRLWQTFFGAGLVKTTEDFGLQGQLPSHPELLDWLAVEFREPAANSGARPWSVKHIVRTIVTSATYRQSSTAPEELWARDPENRLLARGPRHRLPSWMLRDQALAVAGMLTPTMGGPSVKPYQPPGIWEEATFGNKAYVQDHGEALYRRSLYVFWRRIVGPTVFFDTPNRQNCSVKTVITNTPLHALVTLNDTTYVEAARVLAQNLSKLPETDDEKRLAEAFRRVVVREPSGNEIEALRSALKRQRGIFAADREAAEKLSKAGEWPGVPGLDVAEHAAWTQVCLMLLNLDEALTKP